MLERPYHPNPPSEIPSASASASATQCRTARHRAATMGSSASPSVASLHSWPPRDRARGRGGEPQAASRERQAAVWGQRAEELRDLVSSHGLMSAAWGGGGSLHWVTALGSVHRLHGDQVETVDTSIIADRC